MRVALRGDPVAVGGVEQLMVRAQRVLLRGGSIALQILVNGLGGGAIIQPVHDHEKLLEPGHVPFVREFREVRRRTQHRGVAGVADEDQMTFAGHEDPPLRLVRDAPGEFPTRDIPGPARRRFLPQDLPGGDIHVEPDHERTGGLAAEHCHYVQRHTREDCAERPEGHKQADWRPHLRYVGARRLEDREAAQLPVLDPNRRLLAASQVGRAAKLAGTFTLLAEDSHDGTLHVHAADLGLVGIDYARDALVRKKRDFVVLAQRQGGGADYLGREDGLASGVLLNAGAGEGHECCDGRHQNRLHRTEAATRWLGLVRHKANPPVGRPR